MNRIMSKSTKILWIIDLMTVEKLLLRGGWLKKCVGQKLNRCAVEKPP